MPSGTASVASFARSFAIASASPVAWTDVDEQTSSTFEPTAWHICSIAFATSSL